MAITGTITINDNLWEEMKDAFADKWSIPSNSVGLPLYTKAQWVMVCQREMVKKVLREYRCKMVTSGIGTTDIEAGIT